MSYDVWLVIDTGGPEPAQVGRNWNYTTNCSPMWRAAGANLADFHDKTAAECEPVLRAAIAAMVTTPAIYRALDPENGWGSYDTLLPALVELADTMAAHPKATVVVSR